MRITILALGSTGDILPYASLGAGLRCAGHAVSFITSENFRPLLIEKGIDPILIPGDAERIMVNAGASYRSILLGFRDLAEGIVLHAERLIPVLAESDLILNQLPMGAYGFAIAEKYGVPYWLVATIPLVRTASFPMVGWLDKFSAVPGYNRMTYRLSEGVAWQLLKGSINRWRASALGLPSISGSDYLKALHESGLRVLNGFSRHVFSRPTDWGSNIFMTGSWHSQDSSWKASEKLMRFIESGNRPLFIGFGSMPLSNPEETTQLILQALEESGQRAILHKGWGGLGGNSLPDTVFQIDYAAYEWLFPRMAAVIHHGGSGTTAAALRAGVPSLIVPFLFDQFYWGRRVTALGVGPQAIPFRQLTSRRLATQIHRAVEDPALRAQAQQLGKKLQAENGIENATKIIEQFLSGPASASARDSS